MDFTCRGGGNVNFVDRCYKGPVITREEGYMNQMTKTWKTFPPRRQISRDSRHHLQSSLASYGLELDPDYFDEDEDKLNIVPRAHTSASDMALVVLDQADLSRLPLTTPSPDFDCVLTSYFPYRRSGYIDHLMRVSRVNSARVMLYDNPDAIMSASCLAGKLQYKKPEQAYSKDCVDPGSKWVETKEFTTDYRNRFYEIKSPKPRNNDKVKAVRFHGFSEASIQPQKHEIEEFVNADNLSSDEDLSTLLVEYNGIGSSTTVAGGSNESKLYETAYRHQNRNFSRGSSYTYKDDFKTNPKNTNDVNQIPLSPYHCKTYRGLPHLIKNTKAREYDLKTDKVLSYYISRETNGVSHCASESKTSAPIQSAKHLANSYTPPPSRLGMSSRRAISSLGSLRIPKTPTIESEDKSGFIAIQTRSVLHQRNEVLAPQSGKPTADVIKKENILPQLVASEQKIRNDTLSINHLTTINIRL